MPSSHLIILCRPLLLLPPIPPSIRVFSNESTLCMRWPKYWSFSFSIIPSKEHPGLIFRMDWLDLLAVQGTLKSLLQHHSSKASILQRSAFFTVQLSHPYMTTGKTIALTRGTFVGKVMSLLLNMLSRLVTTFFPRSKCLLIWWLQSPSAVILEPRKIKSDTVSTVRQSKDLSPYLSDTKSYKLFFLLLSCDHSHEIKRHLLLGWKAMTNLDSILKSRDITSPTKVHLIKTMVFPVVMYGCESLTLKKAEHQRIDASELWNWRRLLRVPWTARRSNCSQFWRKSVLNIHWKDWCWS